MLLEGPKDLVLIPNGCTHDSSVEISASLELFTNELMFDIVTANFDLHCVLGADC